MNRADLAASLAPVAPACFSSREQWLEYVRAAASHARELHAPGPLRFEAGKPVTFNEAFNHCDDCDAAYGRRMLARGLCNNAEHVRWMADRPHKHDSIWNPRPEGELRAAAAVRAMVSR